MAQNPAPAALSPAPSATATPGTATAEEVVVQSQELDISREAIVANLGATRYPVGPAPSTHRHKAKTLHLTKRFCDFRASLKIHSASFTFAANTPTCNTVSMTCSCPKAFPDLARNSRRVLPIVYHSSPAPFRRNSVFATRASSTFISRMARCFSKGKPHCLLE